MKRHDRVGAVLAISLIMATLAGCSSLRMPDVNMPKLRWPFSAKPVPAPEPVDEVIFEAPAVAPGAAGAVADVPAAVSAFPQYFKRNTLIIDMTAVAGSGSVLLRPKTPAGWPMRVAFRVKPGSFEALEVRADQRVLLPLTASSTRPTQDLLLPPGSFQVRTESMLLRWGATVPPAPPPPAMPAPVPPPPVPAAPEAVVQSPPTG